MYLQSVPVYLIITLSFSSKPVKCFSKPPPAIITSTVEYLSNISDYYKRNERTVVITGSVGMYTTDIINTFAQILSPNPVVIAMKKDIINVTRKIHAPQDIFVFANDIQEIDNAINDSQPIWSTQNYFHFIICEQISHRLWAKTLAKRIWKNKILNFIIVYFYETLRTFEYNPFFEKMFHVNPNSTVVFSNKLKNLNGYLLTVSMFSAPPQIIEENGRFYGTDPQILQGFIKYINASLIIKQPNGTDDEVILKYVQHYRDVYYNKVDFGFVSGFVYDIHHNTRIQYTYPRQMDDIVVVLPWAKRIPQYKYIFLIFNINLWVALLCSMAVVIILKTLLEVFNKKKSYIFLDTFLDTWGSLLNKSTDALRKGGVPVKLLFIFWIYACMIFNGAFQCTLMSMIVTPKYMNNIDTLEQLQHSNTEILINKYNLQNAQKINFRGKTILVEEAVIQRKLAGGDISTGYTVLQSVAEEIMDKFQTYPPTFYILKEHFVPGYTAYVFPGNSPYLGQMNYFISLDKQHGLSGFNTTSKRQSHKTFDDNFETVSLSVEHLQTAFYILLIGYVLSILIFFSEIAYSRIITYSNMC